MSGIREQRKLPSKREKLLEAIEIEGIHAIINHTSDIRMIKKYRSLCWEAAELRTIGQYSQLEKVERKIAKIERKENFCRVLRKIDDLNVKRVRAELHKKIDERAKDAIEEHRKRRIRFIFRNAYRDILEITKESTLVHSAEFEILPVMYLACDMAALLAKKDEKLIRDNIVIEMQNLYEEIDVEQFHQRIELYNEIIGGKPVRGDWYMGDSIEPLCSDPLSKCVVALGDILYNPECAENYDTAPVAIGSFFELVSFFDSIMVPLQSRITALLKEMYEYCTASDFTEKTPFACSSENSYTSEKRESLSKWVFLSIIGMVMVIVIIALAMKISQRLP